jgi:hypothetical protein
MIMATTKNKKVLYTRLTKREKNIIEAGVYVYALFEEPHPLAALIEADDPALQAIQITIRPICRASNLSH